MTTSLIRTNLPSAHHRYDASAQLRGSALAQHADENRTGGGGAGGTALRTLEFRFGGNDEDEDGKSLLAEGLQCALDSGLELDDNFNDKNGADLEYDAAAKCIKPTWDGDDARTCFKCQSTSH